MEMQLTTIRRKIAEIDNIPSVPALVVPLLKKLGEPPENIDVNEIVSLISYDKSLTAQCLHMANSPLLGVRRRVETVQGAVLTLGMSKVCLLGVGKTNPPGKFPAYKGTCQRMLPQA